MLFRSQAVAAIRSIGGSISGIDEKMTAIAAAVEQQRAATTEISRNFQQAAQGTREVTDTIGSVAKLNQETGNAGTVLSQSVKKMSADADRLRVAVEGFLGAVKQFRIMADQRHRSAALGDQSRASQPDAATAAGDDCAPAREVAHIAPALLPGSARAAVDRRMINWPPARICGLAIGRPLI